MESTIRIERYADQGRCVGHIDGRVVFVRFALPGELVRVALDEPHDREDRFWTGEVVEVLEASEDRTDPIWSLAGPLAMGGGVGGADLVHVSLAGQLKWKVTSVAEQMARLGHVDVERRRRDKFHGILARLDMMMADHLVQRGERATQTHAGACLVRVRPEESGKRVAAEHAPGHRQVGKDRERFAAVERCHFAVDIDLRGPQ